MKRSIISVLSFFLMSSVAVAAEKIPVVEVFDGPLDGTVIAKVLDRKAGVICYILSPSYATYTRQYGSNGSNMAYDGNNVGSISCVKSDDRNR